MPNTLHSQLTYEHDLKIALQKVVEQECGALLATYGFRIHKVLTSIANPQEERYHFAVEIYSPQLNSLLTAHQCVYTRELYRMGAISSSLSLFAHVFYKIAREIKYEVEKATREMPVANQYMRAGYTFSNQLSQYTDAVLDVGIRPKPQDQFMPFNVLTPSVTTTKFEHIAALIADSKKRLTSKYVSPEFQFKYFSI